jgi:ATP-dependent Lhr-like helicase
MGAEPDNALCRFHPLVERWFRGQVGQPTDAQQQGWARITAGEHILIAAPTGSGKTLAAFLWALNKLATQRWDTGRTSVLYVSPLKALNNDIQRNLLAPLGALREAFADADVSLPEIRVATRSGDTPQADRRRMQRHPPEILITTPESLNLLLSSPGGRSILGNLKTVILDEVHAVIGNKRGVHLMTAVERLVRLSGEFQRVALSATMRPAETVAEFIGGFRVEGTEQDPRYSPRPVTVVSSAVRKDYHVQVRFPKAAADRPDEESFWEPLVADFKGIIHRHEATLLFVNSRRLCEKLALKINQGETNPTTYAHHGSLSRAIREEVERRLKGGELKAIVATNSLELGIDIGALDEVVMIQSPPSVSSAIQRVGRAGHQVGRPSHGTLFPTHPHDFLEAAVLAPSIVSQDIETARTVECPLDVLAQVIVSMVGVETWPIEALYAQLRGSYPYRHLNRRQFDLVLNMLAGRYADTRIRELRPRVSIDRLDNTVAARKGALLALYLSGGTIPDRGYFNLRHHETHARIGELDEEFVWEASVGQVFALGTQNWKIERITHNDVLVSPGPSKALGTPFWKGEERARDFHFSSKIARFLDWADERLGDAEFATVLSEEYFMEATAAEQLIEFLKAQKEATHSELPHAHHVLVEHIESGPGSAPGNQVVLHTFWGGRVNRPFAMALDAAWEERFGHRLETYVSNDSVYLLLPNEVRGVELLSLVSSATVESLLRGRLESSGLFGARFRECAGRALLLPRNKASERVPLWMSRLRSQKLMEAVGGYEDFPILLEAWRTCLQDEFDLPNLRHVLHGLESGSIRWSEVHSPSPSPMARDAAWRQINHYMYKEDEPAGRTSSRLRKDLLREVVHSPTLRQAVPREVVVRFELKRQRLSPGYSPSSARDLTDWVKERVMIPWVEWEGLVGAMEADQPEEAPSVLNEVRRKLVQVRPRGTPDSSVVALEVAPKVIDAFYGGVENVRMKPMSGTDRDVFADIPATATSEEAPDALLTTLLGEWLQFYGPLTKTFIQKALGIGDQRLADALDDLSGAERIIAGRLIKGESEDRICDSENFETLLRLARSEAVPAFAPLDIKWLALFLATHQGLWGREGNIDVLSERLEQLLCYRLPAGFWESEIFPARVRPYDPSWLDTLMQAGDLRWIGSPKRRVTFCFESDRDLMEHEHGELAQASGQGASSAVDLIPDSAARYDFASLLRQSHEGPSALSDRLWDAVWQGQVTNDTFLALRRGIETHFQINAAADRADDSGRRRRRAGRRGAFTKRKAALTFAGNWFRLSGPELPDNPIEIEECNKDRVRLLLDRYGVLFRELLERESPPFRWSNLFRTLRLMELSGEVLAGCFFEGIPGPQFISRPAFHVLQRKLPDASIFWVNAVDPVSLCGIRLDAVKGRMPRRVESNHLVYRGTEIVLVSRRFGRDLEFRVEPDDPHLPQYLGPLHHLLRRPFRPLNRIAIQTINGEKAVRSPYVDCLRTSFEVAVDYRHVNLYRGIEQ